MSLYNIYPIFREKSNSDSIVESYYSNSITCKYNTFRDSKLSWKTNWYTYKFPLQLKGTYTISNSIKRREMMVHIGSFTYTLIFNKNIKSPELCHRLKFLIPLPIMLLGKLIIHITSVSRNRTKNYILIQSLRMKK